MITNSIQIAMKAINKWVYFSLNYNTVLCTYNQANGESVTEYLPEFLTAIKWTCHISHMVAKWKAVTDTKDAYAYLIRFYIMLDSENKVLLLEWIMGNYNNKRKLFY